MKKHHLVLGLLFLAVAIGHWVYAWQRDSKGFAIVGVIWALLGVLRLLRARRKEG